MGKGTGDRIDHHEKEAKRGFPGDKCSRIREILAKQLKVIKKIESRHEDEAKAYEREFELIKSLAGLTNVVHGCGRPAPKRADLSFVGLLIQMAKYRDKPLAKAFIAMTMLMYYPRSAIDKKYPECVQTLDMCEEIVRGQLEPLKQFVESDPQAREFFGVT